jgi:hypothetical protein
MDMVVLNIGTSPLRRTTAGLQVHHVVLVARFAQGCLVGAHRAVAIGAAMGGRRVLRR